MVLQSSTNPRDGPGSGSYPWSAIASESWSFGVSSVEQLHVVIATVSFLFNLKSLEDKLNTVALFSWDHPLTVWRTRVVIVSKLGMWVKVLSFHLGF